MRVWPGEPYPLGATWDGAGVNFALFSENATKVELCLFDVLGTRAEDRRVVVKENTDQVWHCYLPDALPGQLYGYRVLGPYDPKNGHRFNPNKLLLDPYAKLIGRPLWWNDALFGYRIGRDDRSIDERDSAPFAPLGVVVDQAFTWGTDHPPRTPWHKTLIYELHVRGFTKRMPGVPEKLRGTYAGLVSEPALRHLTDLGVTAVELLPVHQCLQDRHLVARGLRNYWGYNTLGFFAPQLDYGASGGALDAVHEFKMMVRTLHAAGLEVILDVVYNHTAEGNQLGPTLSFRGIDNGAYYRLSPEDPRYYMDFTGCGNMLNVRHPKVLQLIMDSLRYWVTEMHVDGFRFDLASTLARELFEVNKLGAFFDIIHQDPVVSRVKLIAEPWDVGPGGYQIGNFPPGWAEWNGKYRDAVRRFWKGDGGTASEVATRLAGSSDLYERSGRKPYASINFVTCHDGFTLHDLVSCNTKHNEANGENNRDGTDNNNSWNCGHEGPTDDPGVSALRGRQRKNFIATLLLSQGVPMLLAGDEFGRTQGGNNNAYCQDNEFSWLDWAPTPEKQEFLDFVRTAVRLWKAQPVLQRRHFFQGRSIRGSDVRDISFLGTDGKELTDAAWTAGDLKCLGLRLAGDLIGEEDERGRPIVGDTLLVLLSAHWKPIPFVLPLHKKGQQWELVLDTARPRVAPRPLPDDRPYDLHDRSLAVLRIRAPEGPAQVIAPARAEVLLDSGTPRR
jgi:glycogen operon protein